MTPPISLSLRRLIPHKSASTFHSRPSFLCRRTSSSRNRHLADDRRGSAGAVRSLPPSPAVRTRWKSIGDALAPIWTGRLFPGVNGYFYKRERPTDGPTTCLPAGAEGAVRILWNIPGDSALLQWRPAPPTAAGSPCWGGGGVPGRVILLHQQDAVKRVIVSPLSSPDASTLP